MTYPILIIIEFILSYFLRRWMLFSITLQDEQREMLHQILCDHYFMRSKKQFQTNQTNALNVEYPDILYNFFF